MTFSSSRICGMIALTAILFAAFVSRASGQSTDVRFPTGVTAREISGVISARDIGDSRLTDHFYTFNGLPGDLLITIQSQNLNGDFDVFTAAELRPVMKVTVYAESSTAVTKSIYLRKPESLILRVEARSPNDDEGRYSIRFSGSFEPVSSVIAESATTTDERNPKPDKASDRKTKRVSSVGARIEEPAEEASAKPTPEPTPAAATEESPATPPKKVVAARPNPRRPPPRSTPTKAPSKPTTTDADKSVRSTEKDRTTGEAASTTATAKKKRETKPKVDATNNAAAEAAKAKSETSEPTNNPPPSRTSTNRSNRKPPSTTSAEPAPENTQRLLIEVKDGTHIEYLMSNVKRVTVENGVVVIISKQGNTQRVPMSNIVRMSIGP